MFMVQIEHPVRSFDEWKKVFDSDPLGRKKSGVRRYRVSRPMDNPHYVTADLEFERADQAEAMLKALQGLWRTVDGQLIEGARGRVLEVVESKEY